MKKTVTKGNRTAQVTLDGGECEVVFDSRYNFFSVEADNDVVVSLESGKTADDDGVMICKGGGAIKYDHMKSLDRVYVTGEGKVQVVASNTSVENFKKRSRGGDNKVGKDYIQDGLIAEWVLDGNPAELELLTNPMFVPDDVLGRWVGKIANGVSSFYVQKTEFEYTGNDGVTLQCLINIDPSIPQLTQFLTVGENHGSYGSDVALGIGMNNKGSLTVEFPSDDRVVDYTLTPGIWYQLAVVYDNNLSLCFLYINGAEVTTVSKNLLIPRLMSGAAIGAWVWSSIYPQASSSNRGNFLVANCCVYDRPLTKEEINDNYAVDKKRYGLQ